MLPCGNPKLGAIYNCCRGAHPRDVKQGPIPVGYECRCDEEIIVAVQTR